jgi:hypothetical protein
VVKEKLHKNLEISQVILLENFLYTVTVKETYEKTLDYGQDKAIKYGLGIIDLSVYLQEPESSPVISIVFHNNNIYKLRYC